MMPGKGRQPGPRAIGEGTAPAAATGAGQKRRRGREGRSGRRRETEEVAVDAGKAGGEVGVAIEKVRLESGEIRGCLATSVVVTVWFRSLLSTASGWWTS
jgi:hypothetical protein